MRVVTASTDKTARVWNAATGIEIMTLKGHSDTVASAAFSPDGTRIVTGSTDSTARIWDAATGNEIRASTAIKRRSTPPSFRLTAIAS